MKFFAIFLAVAVATALAVPADTSVSNNNSNTVTSNNSNQNSVTTNTNTTSDANCNCPTFNNHNNNKECDNDAISRRVKRLIDIQKGLSVPILNFIAGVLGIDVTFSRKVRELFDIVPQIGVGFYVGLPDGELKLLMGQATDLAGPLCENPILKSFFQPLTDILFGMTIPLHEKEIKNVLDAATGAGVNLLGTGLSGALNITTGLAGQVLNLVPQII